MNQNPHLAAIKRRWWLVVALALLGAVIGAIPQSERVEEQATSFTATHTMLPNEGGDSSIVSTSQVELLATTGEVPARVAERLNFSGNPAELAAQMNVQFELETGALRFSTQQATAEDAEELADAFAEELNSYLAERQDDVYQERLQSSRVRVEDLQQQLDDIGVRLVAEPDNAVLVAERDAISRSYGLAFEQNQALEDSGGQLTFTTLQSAQAVPLVDRGLSAPTSRRTRAMMGMIVGGTLGIIAAVILGRLDNKIRSKEQAEEIMGMRARSTIPRVKSTERDQVVVGPGRHDPLSDSYRTVRNVVRFVQGGLETGPAARVTLIVSPGPGDGKTSMAANLAAAFAESGDRTVAVNADFRRPRLTAAMLDAGTPELPFHVEDLDVVDTGSLVKGTENRNLKVMDLASIKGSPGDLVRALIGHMAVLSDVSDEIIIDTSPIGATAEVLELLPYADVIIVVVRVGHTSIQSAERTNAILRDIATAPTLMVLTGIKAEKNPYFEYSDRRWSSTDDKIDDEDDEIEFEDDEAEFEDDDDEIDDDDEMMDDVDDDEIDDDEIDDDDEMMDDVDDDDRDVDAELDDELDGDDSDGDDSDDVAPSEEQVSSGSTTELQPSE
jgi:Mrp family chromosome partitioning ATPase